MNRVFKRQLKRHFGKDFDTSTLDPNVQEFLQSVEETYQELEKEKKLMENTLEINSNELYEANKKILNKNAEIGTQLKQYKQAMDSALLVNTFSLDNQITFANPNYCELSGFTQEELIGKKCNFLHYQENNTHLYETIMNTIEAKKTWNGLLKYQSKNLELYDLNATIFPILNANDEITEYMSIFQDITAIESSRKKAIELDKAKSLFIANMSHELRTPLNSILGFSQILMRQNALPDKSQKYIEKINFSGEHLLKLINSILDFSKIEAGEVILESIEIDLHYLITHTLEQQETHAKQKSISLLMDYEPSMPRVFLGDSLRITQVLTNLISNAIKFTKEGSVKVLARKIQKDRVQITVQDTGIGLSEDDKAKLFKEFSQVDSSTSREYGGTGLGLSITSELIALMDGKIWVESVKGQGSSFIFEITLQELNVSSTPEIVQQNPEEEEVSIEQMSSLQNKTILLIEDNAVNQLLITSLLEDTPIAIHIANNGLEGLHLIKDSSTPYDLILTDLQMPVMDGFEVSTEIRKNDQKTPIIAISADASKEDIEKTKVIGINKYLSKPIEANTFYSCLFAYLR